MGEPSLGMLKARERMRILIAPPIRYIFGLIGSALGLALLIGVTKLMPGVFMGKAGLIWLIPPVVGLWCLGGIILWPFLRPLYKRQLQLLESADRLDQIDKRELF